MKGVFVLASRLSRHPQIADNRPVRPAHAFLFIGKTLTPVFDVIGDIFYNNYENKNIFFETIRSLITNI